MALAARLDTSAASASATNVWAFMVDPCARTGSGGRTATPPGRPPEGANTDQKRHRTDVREFEPAIETIDVAAQRQLHVPELAAHREHLGTESFNRLPVFLGQNDTFALPRPFEFGQLFLHVLKLRGESHLLLAEPALGIAADGVDEVERAIRD